MKKNIFQRRRYYWLIVVIAAFLFPVSGTPRYALVLSGGGARGLAQIGVLKALEMNGLKPDLIVATSMGAIVGALYAAGYSADSIESLAHTVDWSKIFSNDGYRKTLFVSQKNEPSRELFELRLDYGLKPILPNAISYGQAFYDLLAPLLVLPQFDARSDFDSLPIPLRIIATDLLSGEKVVFSKGNICSAIRASCAVPLAFSPVRMRNTLLIDGGMSANIPVETARQLGAEVVVVIDVTSPFCKKEELANPVKLVDQIVAISVAHQKEREKCQADIIIRPELGKIKNTDFDKIDTLIALGFRSTEHFSDSIATLISGGTVLPGTFTDTDESPVNPPARPTTPSMNKSDSSGMTTAYASKISTAPIIRQITLHGNTRTSDRLLINASGMREGDTMTSALTGKTISSLYATDLFENVNLDIDSAGSGRIIVEEKKYWRIRTGLRFDEFHLGEGYIEPAYENCFGRGIATLLHLQYGLRREKYAFEVHGNHFFTRNYANNVQVQVYSSKERILEKETTIGDSSTMISTTSLHEHALRKTGFNLYLGAQVGRFSLLSLGVRHERFRIQQADADMLGDFLGMSFKKILPYFSIRLIMDSMDKYPFPTTGVKQFLSIGGANKAFGGKYSFIKCTGSIGKYFTFFRYHTLFPRMSFSWASDALPEVERAYLGGAISDERYQELSVYSYIPFSGLPPRAVTGDLFGICHLEYRCEIKRNLFAQLVFDWGTSWKHNENDYQALISDAPLGIGIGLSYMTLLGPIRFSYGQLLKNSDRFESDLGEVFYFSAGYDF